MASDKDGTNELNEPNDSMSNNPDNNNNENNDTSLLSILNSSQYSNILKKVYQSASSIYDPLSQFHSNDINQSSSTTPMSSHNKNKLSSYSKTKPNIDPLNINSLKLSNQNINTSNTSYKQPIISEVNYIYIFNYIYHYHTKLILFSIDQTSRDTYFETSLFITSSKRITNCYKIT